MRILLTAVAAVLYALGWAAGKAWLVVSWLGTAVRVGFTDATLTEPGPVVLQSAAPGPGVPRRPAA